MIDPRLPDYKNTPISPQRPRLDYRPLDAAAAPYVTIVTPFYNTGAVFHETARCVLNQSFQQWEWLIVNDCSTKPEALAVLAEYRQRDPRIRVLDQPANQGPGAARNRGFQEARCEYVFVLDDDDLIEPTAIEKTLWHLESHPEAALANTWSVGFGAKEYLWNAGFERGAEHLTENMAISRSMVRKSAHARAGGYDESIRGGMEDWDFWMRCAIQGLWGSTVPEYLDWYRRRETHTDRWPEIEKREAFIERMRRTYPRLYNGGFPRLEPRYPMPYDAVRAELPCANRLAKDKPRLLFIVPWLTMGGADKFNLDLVEQLRRRGWEITLATTARGDHCWLPDFARHTPDIFMLHNFLRPVDHPPFLRYLIESRRPDTVLVSNSEMGYFLLPYLRANCPEPAYVDFCHSEQLHWNNGGYPRHAVGHQDLLDLLIVSSEALKGRLVARGGDAERIEVAYTNIDADHWAPRPEARARVRAELGIPEDWTVILFPARLSSEKQPLVFARVIEALAKEHSNFIALVAGDGPERGLLEDFIRRHKLKSKIRILGGLPFQKMPELMGACDILFLPSQYEGIALAMFEGMAAGLAIVAADVGGQRELVTPECGALLPRADEETEVRRYTEEIDRLMRDPQRRAAIKRNSAARIRARFTLDKMGDRMVELFAQAADWKRRAPRVALPCGYGLETAVQTVEYLRVSTLADFLWSHRDRLQRELENQKPPAAAAQPACSAADNEVYETLLAKAELEHIENSRAWRLVQRIKHAFPYRTLARLRFGPDWDAPRTGQDPRRRLAEVKASRSYRLIQIVKRTPPYQWYARRKYGRDFRPRTEL